RAGEVRRGVRRSQRSQVHFGDEVAAHTRLVDDAGDAAQANLQGPMQRIASLLEFGSQRCRTHAGLPSRRGPTEGPKCKASSVGPRAPPITVPLCRQRRWSGTQVELAPIERGALHDTSDPSTFGLGAFSSQATVDVGGSNGDRSGPAWRAAPHGTEA